MEVDHTATPRNQIMWRAAFTVVVLSFISDDITHVITAKEWLPMLLHYRVGQSHVYEYGALTVFWQENHQIHSQMRHIYIQFWPTLFAHHPPGPHHKVYT
jgi:hypothetical protein